MKKRICQNLKRTRKARELVQTLLDFMYIIKGDFTLKFTFNLEKKKLKKN